MKFFLLLIPIFFFESCEYINSKLDDYAKKDTAIVAPQDTTPTTPTPVQKSDDETVINVEPTQLRPKLYLVMKDWAPDEKEAHAKQKLLFNNLEFILFKNKLLAVGSPVAWHEHSANQYTVEAGVQLDKRLTYTEPGTYYRQIKRTKAAVVHFFGRRSLLSRAYDSLNVWLSENHQKAVSTPWEEYVSDPKVMKETDFLQTDIYVETH